VELIAKNKINMNKEREPKTETLRINVLNNKKGSGGKLEK